MADRTSRCRPVRRLAAHVHRLGDAAGVATCNVNSEVHVDNLQWRKTVRWICQQFVERSEALGYKGKRRDDAAIDYMVGAAQGCIAAGEKDVGESIGRIVYMSVSTRGYKEIQRLAAQVFDDE